MDGKISEFLKMQHNLAAEKGWLDNRTPEHAPFSILWSIDELGEAIAIIKKKGAEGIMENESVREHFVEEVTDTFMYLFDMMESYGITADEFTRAYVKKYERNMGRSWHENDAMYEKCKWQLIIFDVTNGLPVTARFLEVLERTELKVAVAAVSGGHSVDSILTARGIDSELMDYTAETETYPELYNLFIGESEKGFCPELTVVCTDTEEAVSAAKKYGITCVAIADQNIEKADKTCANFSELQDFLGFNQ